MPAEPATLPVSFREEVSQAVDRGDSAKLVLMELEIKGAPWEDDARAALERASAQINSQNKEPQAWDLVVLFTGHRIDSANRKSPRFPPAKEPVAREAIRQALEDQLKNQSSQSALGIAGGANGGDILFLEVSQQLGIKTEMALALPPDQFAKASVENENQSWMKRFSEQFNKHSKVPVLADSEVLPPWLSFKEKYDIWQRNNLWLLSEALSKKAGKLTLIALWDGQPGDGPGGTEHMVSLAQDHGARVILLDTKQLFSL